MLTLKSTFLPLSNFLFYLYSTKGSSIHNNIYVVYCDALKIGFYVELPKNGFYMISKLKFYSLTTTNLKINWVHILYNFIRSFARNWRAVLIFSGIRYRLDYMLHPFKKVLEERNIGAFIGGRRLRAKVGKSHNWCFWLDQTHMLTLKSKRKYCIRLRSSCLYEINLLLFFIKRFRGVNVYTGNGIRIFKEKPVYKKRIIRK